MPVSRSAAAAAGEAAGGSAASSSSCLRWFNFLSGVFEGELNFEEKLALQVLRRFASTVYERDKPSHEQGFPWQLLSSTSRSMRVRLHLSVWQHMLTGYLRLTEAVTVGQGEPVASRRSARCFARLCLLDCIDPVIAGLCASHAKAFRDNPAGSRDLLAPKASPKGVGGSRSDTALLQSAPKEQPVADKRGGQTTTTPSSRRQQSCEMGEKSAAPPDFRRGAARLQPPRPLHAQAAARACRRQCVEQRCSTIDARVLNAFGHLFVYSCLRLEQELGRRGAWDFDENEGPPQAIPLRCSHGSQLLAGLRRIQEIRRASIEPLMSPHCGVHGRGQPMRHSLFGSSSPKQASPLQSDAKTLRQQQAEGEERSACTTAEEGDDGKRKTTAPSPSQSTAAAPETPCCVPASAAPSLAQSPRASTACRPSRLQGGGEAAAAASPGHAEGDEAHVVSRRAHLCFGDALKDVRNAVDAALSDGTIHTLHGLEVISHGSY
ncbi:hypothetical protein Emed_004490 [Eimeria media]